MTSRSAYLLFIVCGMWDTFAKMATLEDDAETTAVRNSLFRWILEEIGGKETAEQWATIPDTPMSRVVQRELVKSIYNQLGEFIRGERGAAPTP